MKSPGTLANSGISDDPTLEDGSEPGFFEELLSYLQAISNPVRLEIILLIEKHPSSVKEIASHINCSYDNAKKHIERLMKTGIIKKEAGVGFETSKGSLPVWKYSLIPGGMESLIRSLNLFSNLNLKIISEKSEKCLLMCSKKLNSCYEKFPYLAVLGGDDDGKSIFLLSDLVKIGRATGDYDYSRISGIVALSGYYRSVTRIGGFHACFVHRGDCWYFSDLKSTNGSFVNHRAVSSGDEVMLSDGDIIDLGRGRYRARLVFHGVCSDVGNADNQGAIS
ncbi:putative transcriptional regulator [Methanomicrobium sp. W14]|uniref:FHA domain-containing protein n=1 Tax=Methanomicrobium sp. W14 TaxID=2817839 RepID=UPI001AE7A502|nr:FHA domain-containing protein [Methanomicrobium sp. W14]MBP2134145.1 putative transcriptional regulator [Methanomicrobium sp. W14]